MPHNRDIYVNMPVADLDKAMAFFRALDFQFNPQFTDDKSACLIIGEKSYAMFLTRPAFEEFIPGKAIANTEATVEILVAVSAPDREAVDAMIRNAIADGGSAYREAAQPRLGVLPSLPGPGRANLGSVYPGGGGGGHPIAGRELMNRYAAVSENHAVPVVRRTGGRGGPPLRVPLSRLEDFEQLAPSFGSGRGSSHRFLLACRTGVHRPGRRADVPSFLPLFPSSSTATPRRKSTISGRACLKAASRNHAAGCGISLGFPGRSSPRNWVPCWKPIPTR